MSYASETEAADHDNTELAIVESVHFGLDDRSMEWPTLGIGIRMKCGGCALSFSGANLLRALKEADCTDITALKGRPCVIWSEGIGSVCRFVRWEKKP